MMDSDQRAALARTELDRILERYLNAREAPTDQRLVALMSAIQLDRIATALERLERRWRENHPRLPEHVKDFLAKKGFKVEG